MEAKLFNFPIMKDERGALIALEENDTIPFNIKRVYYIYDVKNELRRGYHAHKDLKQVLIAISGSCKILLDNGDQKQVFELDSPAQGLYVDKLIWREMYDFSNDCVLMVLASELYDEEDYLRNYEEFLSYTGSKSYV